MSYWPLYKTLNWNCATANSLTVCFQGNLSELGKLLMQGSFNVWTDHKKGHSKVPAHSFTVTHFQSSYALVSRRMAYWAQAASLTFLMTDFRWRTWPGLSPCRGTSSCTIRCCCSVRSERRPQTDTRRRLHTALNTHSRSDEWFSAYILFQLGFKCMLVSIARTTQPAYTWPLVDSVGGTWGVQGCCLCRLYRADCAAQTVLRSSGHILTFLSGPAISWLCL